MVRLVEQNLHQLLIMACFEVYLSLYIVHWAESKCVSAFCCSSSRIWTGSISYVVCKKRWTILVGATLVVAPNQHQKRATTRVAPTVYVSIDLHKKAPDLIEGYSPI